MKSIVAVVFWDEADWGILGKASELAAVCCGEVHAVFCGEETAEGNAESAESAGNSNETPEIG